MSKFKNDLLQIHTLQHQKIRKPWQKLKGHRPYAKVMPRVRDEFTFLAIFPDFNQFKQLSNYFFLPIFPKLQAIKESIIHPFRFKNQPPSRRSTMMAPSPLALAWPPSSVYSASHLGPVNSNPRKAKAHNKMIQVELMTNDYWVTVI